VDNMDTLRKHYIFTIFVYQYLPVNSDNKTTSVKIIKSVPLRYIGADKRVHGIEQHSRSRTSRCKTTTSVVFTAIAHARQNETIGCALRNVDVTVYKTFCFSQPEKSQQQRPIHCWQRKCNSHTEYLAQ